MISALARALVLTRPPAPCLGPSASSDVYMSTELLSAVKPLPESKKKTNEVDTAREEVKEMFIKAEALLKKVFVQ